MILFASMDIDRPTRKRARETAGEKRKTRRKIADSFARIHCSLLSPKHRKGLSTLAYVERLAALDARIQLTVHQLEIFVRLMEQAQATHRCYLRLADTVAARCAHLNTEVLPFAALFRDIVRYIDVDWGGCGPRLGLTRLFKVAQNEGAFTFTKPLVVNWALNWQWIDRQACFYAMGKHLRIVVSFHEVLRVLDFHHYKADDETQTITRTIGYDPNADVARQIVSGWHAAHYYLTSAIVNTYPWITRQALAVMGEWHRSRQWPSSAHRETTYGILAQLKCVIQPVQSFHRQLWQFRALLPIIANRDVRFRLPRTPHKDDEVAITAFQIQVQEANQSARSTLVQGLQSVTRQVITHLLCPSAKAELTLREQSRIAPYTQGLIMNRIVSYFALPPIRTMQDIVWWW